MATTAGSPVFVDTNILIYARLTTSPLHAAAIGSSRTGRPAALTRSPVMPRLTLACAAALLAASPLPCPAAEPKAPDTEYVFRNATLYDGSGQPGVKGDLHVKGDRIIAVGAVGKVNGAKEIDAAGLVVCPGFIDLHTHCDTGSPALTAKAGRPNKNYVTQGVTTVVTGNCGSGPVDAAKFFADLEAGGVGTNVIHQAPHNSIRARVMGNENRAPTADELAKMEALVAKAMDDGAVGLATGLIYNPGTYARTEEIVALAKVAGQRGRMYASHIRNEGGGLLDAVEEAIRIGRESGCRVHISHIKASGKSAWGRSAQAVGVIEAARRKGQKVTADQYPYIASSTSLRATLVPSKYREGTQADFVKRLDDPKTGPQMRKDIGAALEGRDGGKRIQIANYSKNRAWNGKRIADIAEAEGKEPLDIVLEIERNGGAGVVNFGMSEEDVRVYMKQPWVATASDGSTHLPGATVPHPRSYGTFPRKVGRYAVEDHAVSLEHAIRSATGLPADILELKDRGYLKPGYFADVVVFDPKTFRDTATFDKPHQYAAGVRWVLVNGHAEVADGRHSDTVLGGRVLRMNRK
jgi:N-acyl-D-aspartate/D-glutamate deacylase